MELERTYEHYQNSRDQKILLSFMGIMTQQIMVEYGKIINEQEDISQNRRLVLFSVFVELTQNILRYSAETMVSSEGNRGVGVVVVTECADSYCVNSGNFVTPERAAELEVNLTKLAGMDAEALKLYHKQKRREDPPPGCVGGGVGLIEVARRASEPPRFAISNTPEGKPFFSLSVTIRKDSLK